MSSYETTPPAASTPQEAAPAETATPVASPPRILFGDPQVVSPTVLTEAAPSAHPEIENVETLIFNNFVLSLQQETQDLSAIMAFTLRLPVTIPDNQAFLGYLNSLHGAVTKDADSRVVLYADLGGTFTVFDFPYDEACDEPLLDFKPFFSLEQRAPADTNIPRPPIPPYLLTLVLSVQRRVATAGAFASLGSLDITPVFG